MSITSNSAIIRAMRAYMNADQATIAAACGLSLRTYIEAERGRACSPKTFDKIIAYHASQGARLVNVPCGACIHWRIEAGNIGAGNDRDGFTDIDAGKKAGPPQRSTED